MADQDRDELIAQFAAISGVDSERARFYLESAAWQLETALSGFYEDGEDAGAGEDLGERPDTEGAPSTPKKDPPQPQAAAAGRLNMFDDGSSSDDEEQQAFYAGGSEHSGQQLLGPKKKDKKKDVVASLFKSAKEHGAEVLEGQGGSKKKRPINFVGTGYKLGQTDDDHQEIPDARLPEDKPRDVMLRMWKTGFTVDDGELRPYEDPINAEFLTSIKRSEVPLELIRQARGGEVYINMADHRHEDYVQKKKPRQAFGGSGHTLGSMAPSVVGQETRPAGASGGATGATAMAGSSDPKILEKKAQDQVALDSSQPTTNIQVRLPDGSRMVLKLNHSHTVGTVRQFVTAARPSLLITPFALMTTFPYAEMSNDSQTVADAKLLNSALVVKPK